ncbi:hypothetical protein G6W75_09975 [Staphylococcus sciuri]|uniref:YopX family protein n=1 Tax=Mammaliicoccus sciuri TaxID=1296 RepID=UPI0013E94A80|nr:YopX family protein [Mammaliicoccus sciuri]NGX76417.1 hypothetical protein [Mammaliicoccus sciuri]
MIPRYKAIDNETGVMLRVLSIDLEFDYIIGLPFEEEARDTFGELIIEKRYYFEDMELLQSTGLFDKNGKEIYIGDILKWQGTMGHGWFEDVQDEVIYDKQELRFKFKNRNENIRNIANISVVAGNRIEHPHLLGED